MESPKNFCVNQRNELLNKITNQNFDIIIIGGGITGAGIALDATLRGMKTILVEKEDFAFGTSSRSTKLVHGGLRYLKQFEFSMVKKLVRERDIVYQNAAHIVIPQPVILAFRMNKVVDKTLFTLALKVYDFFGKVKKLEKSKVLSKNDLQTLEPLLFKSEKIGSAALYYEYKTDDTRLTLEIVKKAVELGAICLNYSKVKEFVYSMNKVSGVEVNDSLTGINYTISGKYVINATGIWADTIRKMDNSLQGKTLHLTKGIHIVVSKQKFPINQMLTFFTSDNRLIFAIPRFSVVYIGSTDTNYKDNLNKPIANEDDINYLLKEINANLPNVKLTISDVESSWAGIRPLIHEAGKAPSEISRKEEIILSKSGLFSIIGGKLTGYRLMAKKIVDWISIKMRIEHSIVFYPKETQNVRLSGGDFPFEITQANLIEYADKKYDEAKQTGISVENFKALFYCYGTNIEVIIDKAYDFWNETRNTEKTWLKAEIWYSVNFESTANLTDFFIRRTGMTYFKKSEISNLINLVANEMQFFLNWTDNQKEKYIHEFIKNL